MVNNVVSNIQQCHGTTIKVDVMITLGEERLPH